MTRRYLAVRATVRAAFYTTTAAGLVLVGSITDIDLSAVQR